MSLRAVLRVNNSLSGRVATLLLGPIMSLDGCMYGCWLWRFLNYKLFFHSTLTSTPLVLIKVTTHCCYALRHLAIKNDAKGITLCLCHNVAKFEATHAIKSTPC